MQATFDNKINLLSANIRSSVDDSVLYSITTSHNLWGRTVTLLKDANPAPGNSPIVGAIYWRERIFMVHGQRKSISDIKRRPPGFAHAVDAKPIRNGPRQRTQSLVTRKDSITATGKAPSRKPKGAADKPDGQDGDKKRKRPKSVTIAAPPTIISPLRQYTSDVPLPSVLLGKFSIGSWWRSLSCITRYWRWASDRTEYEMAYHHERWKALAILDHNRNHERHHHHEKKTLVPGHHGYSTASAGRNSGSEDTLRSLRHRSVSFSSSPSRLSAEKVLEDELLAGATKEEEEEEDQRIAAGLRIPHRNHLFHKNKAPVLQIKPSSILQDEVFLILVMIYSETKRQDKTNTSGGW